MRTRVADLYLGKIDGKEGSGNGEELLWHARSRRHGHRFLWFLLHLKGLNVVLRAEPVTKKVQEPKKCGFQIRNLPLVTGGPPGGHMSWNWARANRLLNLGHRCMPYSQVPQ